MLYFKAGKTPKQIFVINCGKDSSGESRRKQHMSGQSWKGMLGGCEEKVKIVAPCSHPTVKPQKTTKQQAIYIHLTIFLNMQVTIKIDVTKEGKVKYK